MKLLKSLKGKVKRICGKYYVFKYKQRIKNNMNLIGRYGTFRFISEFSVEDFKRIKKYNDDWNLSQIQKKSNIRLGFLVYTSSMWNVDSLYKLLSTNTHFKVSIIVGHFGKSSIEATNQEYNSTLQYFRDKGYPVLESHKVKDVSDYDIIFSLTPFRMIDEMDFFSFPLSTILLHTSYSYMLSGKTEKINEWMYHFSLRYYTDSMYYKNMVESSKLYSGTARYLGFPKMDAFYLAECIRKSNKRVIIYAPHHSVTYSKFKSATFEDNYLAILNLAKKYSDDTYWIYKPHPLLRGRSVEAGIFNSVNEYDEYENSWNMLQNGEVVSKGDYYSIFKGSDAMITDSVSFLAEYQFTNKPLLLLESGKEQYNEFGNSIVDILYRCPGADIEAIETFIHNVIVEKDEMKKIRQDYFSKNLDYKKDGKSASQLIYEDILSFVSND